MTEGYSLYSKLVEALFVPMVVVIVLVVSGAWFPIHLDVCRTTLEAALLGGEPVLDGMRLGHVGEGFYFVVAWTQKSFVFVNFLVLEADLR